VKFGHAGDRACWTVLTNPIAIDLVEQGPLFDVGNVDANLHEAAPVRNGLLEAAIDVGQHLLDLISECVICQRRAAGVDWQLARNVREAASHADVRVVASRRRDLDAVGTRMRGEEAEVVIAVCFSMLKERVERHLASLYTVARERPGCIAMRCAAGQSNEAMSASGMLALFLADQEVASRDGKADVAYVALRPVPALRGRRLWRH